MENKYEHIMTQKSDFVDIYRIENGTLLYVNKFKRSEEYSSTFYYRDLKKHSKIVRGCKGLIVITEEFPYKEWLNGGKMKCLPVGLFLLNGIPVEKVEKEDYHFQIKTSEGMSGNNSKVSNMLEMINDILKYYKF